MKKRQKLNFFLTIILFLFIISSLTIILTFLSLIPLEKNTEHSKLEVSKVEYTNARVICDGYNGTFWNDEWSGYSDIAVDDSGGIHVVWADRTNGTWIGHKWDSEIMYARYTEVDGWSNATVISDGYMGFYWNVGGSNNPAIAIDNNNHLHVVWEDSTHGVWGNDDEIMYVNYTEADGWSNATVISDGYMGEYWNDDWGGSPDIAVDDSGNIHIVWYDNTDGVWGVGFDDSEIMYVNYTDTDGWSNATVISDGYMGEYWNDGHSHYPAIAVNNSGDIHVVWEDTTDGLWGSDTEIMYTRYTKADGWSNATVISDGYMGEYWNDGHSLNPAIAVDISGNIHIVWYDDTDGVWGIDKEIMYVRYTEADGWSNTTVISDGYMGIFAYRGGVMTLISR